MRTRICLIAFLLMALIGGLFAQQPKSVGSELIQKLTFPEIKWQIPELGKEVTVDTLKNGIVLFMMEDHRLPIINIRGIVRTGSMYDPAGKEGLGSLTGTLIRMGGTTTLPADSLNAILEYLAASIETWIGSEQGGAYLNCLAKDLDRCLQIYADLLINPAFPQDKINLQKDKIKESIKRRNDTPSSIATREFWHLLYEDHPYGRILEWASIKNITREDLVAFHRTYFAPNNLWLGITGDFNIVELKSKLEKVFGRWQPRPIDFPPEVKVKPQAKPGIYVIDRADLTQTNIYIGHFGIRKDNPDRYALALMNYILGGGSFNSRMTSIIRSDMGLAYSVGSTFELNSRDIGLFYADCQTKTETTYKAVFNIIDQIKKITAGEVTPEEFAFARDSYINRFVFTFTDPAGIVSSLMNLEYDGMPRNFYKDYIANIEKVTIPDILTAAKTYLRPDSLSIFLVGNRAGFEAEISQLGKITEIELLPPQID